MGRISVASHATMNAFSVRSLKVVCLLVLGLALTAVVWFMGDSNALAQNSVRVLWHTAPTPPTPGTDACNHDHIPNNLPPVTVTVTAYETTTSFGTTTKTATATATATATVTVTATNEPAATTTTSSSKKMGFNMLTREEKQRIALHLQDVVQDYQVCFLSLFVYRVLSSWWFWVWFFQIYVFCGWRFFVVGYLLECRGCCIMRVNLMVSIHLVW